MQSSKPLVSLCMIVKNEANLLSCCLESVKPFVDEMIIVDTGSKDRTIDIARSLGATVYPSTWQEDFSQARNVALAKASGNWILVMDADEEWDHSAESSQALRELITSTDADALQIMIRNRMPASDLAQFQDFYLTRMFRNAPGYLYEGRIHEQIRPSIERQGGKIIETPFVIWHHGYTREYVQGGEKRLQRNLRLLETAVAEEPEKAYWQYHLGTSYKDMGEISRAEKALSKALSLDGGELGKEIREKLLARLGQLALAGNDYNRASQLAQKSLGLNPNNLSALYVDSLARIYRGELVEALHGFEQIRHHPNTNPNELNGLEQIIHFCQERISLLTS